MLNSIKSKTKKILCCFTLCLGMLASALSGLHFAKDITVSAQSNNKLVEDVTSSVVGTGYNFNSNTSSKPVSPSGWTKTSDSSNSDDNIISGVVNVESETDFDSEECGTICPSMPIKDKDTTANPGYYKNLMINSTNGASRYGYKRSSSITLEQNSFYRIGVTLYTQQTDASDTQSETDARASIYLTGLVDKDDEQYDQSKFEYFTTLNSWDDYYFYIDTNEEVSINIELWLGSKTSSVEGAVFFNEVNIQRYSEDAYVEYTAGIDRADENDNYNFISLGTESYAPVTNSSFENVSMDGWTRTTLTTSNDTDQQAKSVDVNTFSKVSEDLTISVPGSNCSIDNSNALFMYNKTDGYQAIESEPFTIDRQTYYKLSFWAKSDCGTGTGATVKLVDKSEENAIESSSLTLSTTASKNSNKFRNDWTNYTFYIYGPATASKTATIQIWLGTQESKTSGYVFVDDFTMEVIDHSIYSANSSKSNCTTFNLNNGADAYTVNNSDFDKTENNTSTNFYPANPTSWTRSGDNNTTTLSGVVNTTEDSFDTIEFTSIAPNRPRAIKVGASEDNNVLMIGSTAETNSQTFTSSSLSLSANSYYAISFYVNTDYLRNSIKENYGARVQIASANTNIFDLQNIHYADDAWHKIEVKVKTGTTQLSPTVNLMFADCVGYVFFDKVELRSISETLYNTSSLNDASTEYYKIDLTRETFDNRTYNKNLVHQNGIDTPTNWTANSTDSVTSGIIPSNNDLINNVPESLSGNTNYLYISSLHDSYYSFSTKENQTFNSSTYYKIQINVLTNNIEKEEDKDEDIEYGASIALSNSKILIKGINTEGIWKTYTIYASFTSELTTNITLALGYIDETVRGDVLFDNLVISSIDQATYKSELADADDLSTIATFIDYTEPEEETEDSEDESTWENNVNWFIVPSLITALAIIIAVVGFYAKKININKKPKVKTNYDRRKTLDKDIDRREKIALRRQIIAELVAELDVIDKEIADFNVLAEQHLEEVRQQIKIEQEELQKSKLEIEIRKKEATALREKKLKESPEAVQDKKAEKQYNDFIAKLDKQELSIQKKISAKEMKISTAQEANKQKVSRFLERKEYIKLQIAKIEAEIEEIARQEEQLWAEYKAAKEDAKRRKAEYKAQVRAEKEKAKVEKTKAKTAKKSSKDSADK